MRRTRVLTSDPPHPPSRGTEARVLAEDATKSGIEQVTGMTVDDTKDVEIRARLAVEEVQDQRAIEQGKQVLTKGADTVLAPAAAEPTPLHVEAPEAPEAPEGK